MAIEWATKQEHLVLFMDIMGFKDRVARTDVLQLKDRFTDFKTKNIKLSPLLGSDERPFIGYSHFSDSIVLVSRACTKEDLNRITKAAAILMHVGMESGFALKGCIAKGAMIYSPNEQLFFGQALVDAYLLEEEVKFYGVVYHHSVESLIEQCTIGNWLNNHGNKRFIPIDLYDVPLKSGHCEHYVLSWHKVKSDVSKGDNSSQAKKWLKDISKTVSGSPRIYVDNTLNFINKLKIDANA